MKRPCVYVLANKPYGTLYIGVTSDIAQRVWQHQSGEAESFTKRYAIYRLVHVEFHESMLDAITREKRMKKWNRAWKIRLIEETNPEWRDLADDFQK